MEGHKENFEIRAKTNVKVPPPELGGLSCLKNQRKVLKMENKKYKKSAQINRFKISGSGRYTNYTDALSSDESKLLSYAQKNGYVKSVNIAPRGGKWGEVYEVVKFFTTNSLTKKMLMEEKELNKKLSLVLKSDTIRTFFTDSEIGCFLIDGVNYSNFCGDSTNKVEICACNINEFKNSKYITRRQIFNPDSKISIVKFDEPKTINVFRSDVDEKMGFEKINSVIGFCIWECKLKIFVAKES